MQQQRLIDAGAWLESIVADATVKLGRTKEAAAEVRIHVSKPFLSSLFVALRRHFAAKAMEYDVLVDDAVTPVASLRRGARPVDVFSVMHDQLVNDLMGPNVTVHHDLTSGSIVKLVAPFDFYLRGRKDAMTGDMLQAKELIVKAHMVALVPNYGNPAFPIFLMDAENFAYTEGADVVYRRTLATAILSMAGVPAPLRNWAIMTTQ